MPTQLYKVLVEKDGVITVDTSGVTNAQAQLRYAELRLLGTPAIFLQIVPMDSQNSPEV